MKKTIVIVTIVAVLSTAAFFFYNDQAKKLENMSYKLIGISFDSVSLLQDTVANVKFRIQSESTLEALVKNMDLRVLLDGREIGTIKEVKPFVVPAKGYSDVELKITTNLLNAGKTVMELAREIAMARDAYITFTGVAKVKAGFITFPIPVNYTDSIKNFI